MHHFNAADNHPEAASRWVSWIPMAGRMRSRHLSAIDFVYRPMDRHCQEYGILAPYFYFTAYSVRMIQIFSRDCFDCFDCFSSSLKISYARNLGSPSLSLSQVRIPDRPKAPSPAVEKTKRPRPFWWRCRREVQHLNQDK
ncbi:hypothetical protein CABS01_13569 [Colletotrichum abscissum]|uniref:uncharacterized protein n=1 Tax=Colletotrichum abscissum TaxID=1671311 RepID=UPI0027D6C557|nr:uncharacterized protein CABS01_13569 [Colletotrichum abscissum]KAK1485274.1 hypothetical protein CABS01_13569 [Colletotrichum abscissum]